LSKRFELLEQIRQKVSMSKQIVAQKDHEYAWYSGASYDIGVKMARIDFILKNALVPASFMPMLKLYRSYLDQQRKAFFASVGCTEISKLGFILGLEDDSIKATR